MAMAHAAASLAASVSSASAYSLRPRNHLQPRFSEIPSQFLHCSTGRISVGGGYGAPVVSSRAAVVVAVVGEGGGGGGSGSVVEAEKTWTNSRREDERCSALFTWRGATDSASPLLVLVLGEKKVAISDVSGGKDDGVSISKASPPLGSSYPTACQACGKQERVGGCNGEGRILGGLGAVPGFGWFPIKAYRPCPAFVEAGGKYKRQGQSLEEVAFGRTGKQDNLDITERLLGGDKK